MSAIKKRRADPADPLNSEKMVVAIITATTQTGVVAFAYTPGYAFQITRVRSYNLNKAGAVSFKVLVDTREAVASGTFTDEAEVAQTLSTTLADLRGSSTDAITIEYTTDGSGVLTNGHVVLEFRPYPMRGEVAPGDA